MSDTIAAIATPLGQGGICVIRVSGEEALAVADAIIKTKKVPVTEMNGYQCAYARAFDCDGEIDEAVVSVFRAPHSYTGEDVVEIAAHGGVYIAKRILSACCGAGARQAEGGEFTKRAFLNGKIDLTQAEAVADLIAAQGKQAAAAALTARDGAMFTSLRKIAENLKHCAANLAAWIDYPEEGIDMVDNQQLLHVLEESRVSLQKLVDGYEQGKILKEGIPTVIAGKPNTGKSTLMNLLAKTQRSIVADVEGTTRDIITECVRVGDIDLMLADTAGIRESNDEIEKVGVERAQEQMRRAQLVLAVFDGSRALNQDDEKVMEACDGLTSIAIVNKDDLQQVIEMERLKKHFSSVICMSAKSGQGEQQLVETIHKLFEMDKFDASAPVAANERQRGGVLGALREVQEAIDAMRQGVSFDAVEVCIEAAMDEVLSLTGEKASQQVVDDVFSRFCVGK